MSRPVARLAWAFSWICPACSRLNFVVALDPGAEAPTGPDAIDLTSPPEVTCSRCRTTSDVDPAGPGPLAAP